MMLSPLMEMFYWSYGRQVGEDRDGSDANALVELHSSLQ